MPDWPEDGVPGGISPGAEIPDIFGWLTPERQRERALFLALATRGKEEGPEVEGE